LNVTFSPTSIGIKLGTVDASLVAGATGLAGVASGIGIGPNPEIACPGIGGGIFNCPATGSTYSFGNVATTITQIFTVTNNQTLLGAAARPFVISSISVTKQNSGNGSYARATGNNSGTCTVGNTLAVGASCTIGVSFTSPFGNNTTTGLISVSGTSTVGPGIFTATRSLTGN
jgi:hypothetical protein